MMEKRLPEGWGWKRLGDVATYINGRAFKPTEWTDNGKPIIRIQNLTDESNSFNYFNGECESRYCIKNGDILISWSASLGIFVWNRGDAFLNQHIFKAILNEKIIDRHFFVFVIRTILEDMKRKTHGSTMKHIIKSEFNNTPIPLPPIETQRKIVAILEKAEETKKLRMQADEFTDRLLQSVFLEMFGDPVKNPKGWEKSKIREITVHHKQGFYTNSDYVDEGIKLIRITDITEFGKLFYDNMPFLRLDTKTIEQFKVQIGDFLFARSGVSIGRCAIVEKDIPCVFGSYIIRFRFDLNKINNKVFLFLMKLPQLQAELKKYGHGSANPNINAENIKNIEVIVPPLPLQQKFVQIVEKVEATRQNQEQSRQEIDNLFNALMQKAFKGELTT